MKQGTTNPAHTLDLYILLFPYQGSLLISIASLQVLLEFEIGARLPVKARTIAKSQLATQLTVKCITKTT